MEPIHFSLSTTKTKPLTYSLFNGVTDSEEEAILNLFPFFGANSLAKNVSEKQHVFCRHRIQSEHPREHAARGGLILTGFSSITHESDKDDNRGCGGRRQQSADGGKQNWWAEMRRRQTGKQATNRHYTAIVQRKLPT
jgi:hypothetical protein